MFKAVSKSSPSFQDYNNVVSYPRSAVRSVCSMLGMLATDRTSGNWFPDIMVLKVIMTMLQPTEVPRIIGKQYYALKISNLNVVIQKGAHLLPLLSEVVREDSSKPSKIASLDKALHPRTAKPSSSSCVCISLI